MNRIIIAALLGIISSAIASAGDFATEMADATFKLFNADSTATCILVRREAPDQNLYLVTAAHVFDGVKGDTAIVGNASVMAGGCLAGVRPSSGAASTK